MGPFTVPLRSCLIVLACLALVVGTALPEVRAQGVDSPLVGKWEGNWVNLSHPNACGEYTMTVTKVEGDKVYGHIERLVFDRGALATTLSARSKVTSSRMARHPPRRS
jgi:hypothetical protein